MGYAYYIDDVRFAYRVNLDTGTPEHFQYGSLEWRPMSGMGALMAKISNGDAQQTTKAKAERTVTIIHEVKARRDGRPLAYIESEVEKLFDSGQLEPVILD
ncbi:hypothetical protein GII33_20680 [Gordonia pseudamarae]|jgi:hypothetical protein|uniref:hypothetical protein n=1 Tax=Gordonia TaxID=2053 RepID=UPI00198498B9|nr:MULTISPECIES: hypothetical protein [Gordonia]MBD0024590.1 hypothetical protein [Gordonia sp. (in: high G+C Gram-positive bacteria)]QHN28028.1 hypothetical protein GII33_20680 [Gordonia pseudamarae]